MKTHARKVIAAAVFAACVAALGACNRGYGCPNDFSLQTEQPSALD